MTAAVAGAAARTAGGRAAASGAARSTASRAPARAATRSGNRPRPNADEREANAARRTRERGERAAGEFRQRYMDPARAEKKKPKEEPADTTPESSGPSMPTVNVTMPGAVSSGAGFILALAFWTWVALPFLKNGPEGVRAMLKAKFTNKRPDGSYLP